MLPLLPLLLATSSLAQDTWCGKNYMKGTPVKAPGGEFPLPPVTSQTLLAFRCAQAIRPYIPGDANTPNDPSAVSILVDTPVSFNRIANAAPISIPSGPAPSLQVTVSANGKTLASGTVRLNTFGNTLPFSLEAFQPRTAAYNISCSAILAGTTQTFHASSLLTYLPNPPPGIGSVTKMDMRTGALLARPANGKGGPFAPVLPIGFYTQFDSYLAKDLSISATLAKQGFTVVHPIPTFTNMTALDLALDKMQEAGLYLMYDMRSTYMNATSVTAQVNHIKSRPNLLLWYTADEPDGTSDPLDATLKSSNHITSLDGGDGKGGAGYHPVSLVLNCENYHFTEYTEGCDIVLQDTYMVGNNVTFSSQWGTPCTTDFGDCGCDNCHGSFEDISVRMDEFHDRLLINGWERTKAVWAVPQGFGNETYWKRYPTGPEWVVESVVGINHGALGVVSWDDPTPADIKSSASTLALALPKMTPFILSPVASFNHSVTSNRIDVGLWTVNGQTLVLATNMNSQSGEVSFSQLGIGGNGGVVPKQVLEVGGASLDSQGENIVLQGVATGAWIVQGERSDSGSPVGGERKTNQVQSSTRSSLHVMMVMVVVIVSCGI